MQDNSFEKNMEHELHELNIEPSQKVWKAVETALDKKKRRYIFGWWWLLPLLLAGSASIWYFNTNNKKQPQDNETVIASKQPATVGQPAISSTTGAATVAKETPIQINESSAEISQEGDNKNSVAKNNYRTNRAASIRVTAPDATNDDETNNTSHKKISQKGKQHIRIVSAALAADTITDVVAGSTIDDNEQPVTTVPEVTEKEQQFTIAKQGQKAEQPIMPDTTVSTTPSNEKKKRTKWNKEWIAGGGMVDLGKLGFSGTSLKNLVESSGVGSPANPPVRELNEYVFKSGVYLTAGLNVTKPLSKKTSWSTGLHYTFQNINVNRRKVLLDSAFTGSPSGIRTFKENLYLHKLTIPLLVNFSVGNKINISTGLYNSFSFSSNWNKYSGVLGKEKKYLSFFHLDPSYRLNNFSVGPFINIGLQQYSFDQRLFNYGLQLKYIPKK